MAPRRFPISAQQLAPLHIRTQLRLEYLCIGTLAMEAEKMHLILSILGKTRCVKRCAQRKVISIIIGPSLTHIYSVQSLAFVLQPRKRHVRYRPS
jgi:hypothetical protein